MVSPFSFDRDGTGQQSLTLLLLECLYIFLLVLVSFYILLEYFLNLGNSRFGHDMDLRDDKVKWEVLKGVKD